MPTVDTNQSQKNWDTVGFGMHICSIHRNKDEQFAPLVPFFSDGRMRREKCMYIFDENSPEEVYSQLDPTNITSEKLPEPSALQVVSRDTTYTKDGSFDPDTMISRFNETLSNSLDQGFSGLRVAAEMSWVITSSTPIEKLFEYESKINDFFPTSKLIGVCQFNEEKFTRQVLIQMICTHPYLIIYGKLYKNKYFYTNQKIGANSAKRINPDDYQTVLSLIMDDEPIAQ